MQEKKSNNWKLIAPILILTAIMFLVYLPRNNRLARSQEFAEPLATHAVPADTEVVQIGTGKEDEAVIAALLLKTELSSEALIEFYSDTEYPPYEEGETVSVLTKDVDEGTLEAMAKAGVYEEDSSYIFLYIKSE